MHYVYLILTWAIYLFFHSLFASKSVKKYFDNLIGLRGSTYRLLYSIFSTIGLLGIGWWMSQIPSRTYFDPGIFKNLALIVAFPGVVVLILSFRHLSGSVFLGLSREREHHLVTKGIHSRVRHPIYTGTILLLIALFLYDPTDVILVTDLVIFIYLPFGIYFEEKKLIREFGSAYQKYKQEVPSIIPKI